MSAHIFQFRGTEADADHSSAPRHAFFTDTEPLSDDEREQLAEESAPTTRRFARSMYGTDAAFRNSPEYADPIERFERALTWIDARWPLWFAIAAGVGLVLALLKKAGWF